MPRKVIKRLICNVHDEIVDLSLEAQDLIDKLNILKKEKNAINKILKKIVKDAEEAKEYGQKMEDRLSEYKNGIEDIGFDRKK